MIRSVKMNVDCFVLFWVTVAKYNLTRLSKAANLDRWTALLVFDSYCSDINHILQKFCLEKLPWYVLRGDNQTEHATRLSVNPRQLEYA